MTFGADFDCYCPYLKFGLEILKQCYLTLNALYLLRATAIHKLNAILKRGLLFVIFLQFRKSQ